jgi:hypothetical protein
MKRYNMIDSQVTDAIYLTIDNYLDSSQDITNLSNRLLQCYPENMSSDMCQAFKSLNDEFSVKINELDTLIDNVKGLVGSIKRDDYIVRLTDVKSEITVLSERFLDCIEKYNQASGEGQL